MEQKKVFIVETWHIDRDGAAHDRLLATFATKAGAVAYLKEQHDNQVADLDDYYREDYKCGRTPEDFYDDYYDGESFVITYTGGDYDRGELFKEELRDVKDEEDAKGEE